jgi:hypothetical protein
MTEGRGWMPGLHLTINPLKPRNVDDVAVRARRKDAESVLLEMTNTILPARITHQV